MSVDQLRALVKSALASGATDLQIAAKLAGIEPTERFTTADLSGGLGPKTRHTLRILAAESAFLKPPAAAVPVGAPLTREQQQALLARTRAYTLNYIHNLPDFICTRTTHRYDDSVRLPVPYERLQGDDVTSSELTYSHGQESDAPHIVDRPTCGPIAEGLTSYGEFGSIIAALFADGGGARPKWGHWEILSGKRSAVFSYSIDQAHSNYTITWCCWSKGRTKVPQQVKTAYRGEVSIDPDTGAILRVTRRALPPMSFPTSRTDTMVEYRPVRVGETAYLCPVRSVTVAGSMNVDYVNEMLFTNYHKFVTSSVLRFGWPQAASLAVPAPSASKLPGRVTGADTESAEDCSEEAAPNVWGKTPPAAMPSTTVSSAAAPRRPSPNTHLRVSRFSPDGRYVLAQDDLDIAVLTVQPFAVLFRIPADNSTLAQFTPDSKEIVFLSSTTRVSPVRIAYTKSVARVERWRIANQALVDSTPIQKPVCGTEELSPDGRVLACNDLEGTLQLIDVASGQTIFEKKRFVELVDSPNGKVGGDLGAARMAFSPDGRFFVALHSNGEGNIQAWDLRERTAVKVPGSSIGTLSWTFHFAFVAPDRFMESSGSGYKHHLVTAKLVTFPSGRLLMKPRIPWGNIFRAADPSFVLVRPFGEFARDTPDARAAAVEFATGQVMVSDTSALDVFGSYFVAEPRAGEIGLYERGKGLQASVVIVRKPPTH